MSGAQEPAPAEGPAAPDGSPEPPPEQAETLDQQPDRQQPDHQPGRQSDRKPARPRHGRRRADPRASREPAEEPVRQPPREPDQEQAPEQAHEHAPEQTQEQEPVLVAMLSELAEAVGREHERAAHREAVIDRLHAENTALRRGELQAMFEPVRAALYRLHDLTRQQALRWRSDPPEPEHAATLLAAVADEIAEALARTGVERFTVEAGEPYDPARHRPVASEPVTDPGLDGSVLRAHTDGFARGERVVRKAEVCVGRPAPATSTPAPLPRANR